MTIIELLEEHAKEVEAEQEHKADLQHKLSSRQWKVYEYLKLRCVGLKNAIQGKDLVIRLKEYYLLEDTFSQDYDNRLLRSDIRRIREVMSRRVGSSSKGYWLMTRDDEIKGTQLLEKQFLSITETLINLGIDTKVLHSIIGYLGKTQSKMVDNQGTLPIGNYLREVIKTYSDDLS